MGNYLKNLLKKLFSKLDWRKTLNVDEKKYIIDKINLMLEIVKINIKNHKMIISYWKTYY